MSSANSLTVEDLGSAAQRDRRKRILDGMQSDPKLTEALTRAFMFADASVAAEIHQVGMLLTSMLTRAMYPDGHEVTEEDVQIARVIGDVWLSNLVAWVTRRASVSDVAARLELTVHLLLDGAAAQTRS